MCHSNNKIVVPSSSSGDHNLIFRNAVVYIMESSSCSSGGDISRSQILLFRSAIQRNQWDCNYFASQFANCWIRGWSRRVDPIHLPACLWWTYIPCQSVTVQVNSSHTKRTPNARHKRNLTHFHKDPYIRSFSNRLLCLNCALSRLFQGAEYPRHDSYSQLTISCQNKRCDRTCQKGNWLQQKLTPWLTYAQKNSVNINDSCAKKNTQVGMCIIKIIKWSI